MKEIVLRSIHVENFKIFKDATFNFSRLTKIFGQNYKGKSSIADAFTWVLFGKSATGNSEGKQFHPRRYDESGIDIDHVDIVGELVLFIDGRDMTIRKVQKQNWVRKRGAEVTTYEGDTNEYFWNEVPVKESEHKKRVAEIIDEEVFQLITNPHAFVSKKQDEQREFLVKKVAQITDEDVFVLDGSFSELRSKMEAEGRTLDEIKAINKNALSGYKEQKESIPIRIDEKSKEIIEVDFSAQEAALAAKKEELSAVEAKLNDLSKSYEDVSKIKTEIAEYKSKISDIENAAKTELSKKRQEATSKLDGIAYNILRKTQQLNETKSNLGLLKEKIAAWEISFEALKKQYTAEKAIEFDKTQNICPVCGKEFDEPKKAELLQKFEEEKKAKLYQLNLDGKKIANDTKAYTENLPELETQVSTLTAEIEKFTAEQVAGKDEISRLPVEPDLSGNKEYKDYKASLSALEFSLKDTMERLTDTNTLRDNLSASRAEIQGQIKTLEGVILSKVHIEEAKKRVAELEEEFKRAVRDAAECERLDLLIEKFETAKRKMLSERINKFFKVVKWVLFQTQKNGGTENVCVCMIHGSVYGENTTSTTERLMAGLDIVATLQDIYQIKAPVFIDDADLYNDWNIPEMDCQMILLLVDEDENLRVEGTE